MASAGARPPGILGDLLCDDLNDACCWACSGGGDVVCCDGCRAVYHLACIGLKELPEDDWFCPLCHCKECNLSSRDQQDVSHIRTKLVPIRSKSVNPRQSAQQRLPTGPGYLCPQQVRQWLQQQPSADLSAGETIGTSACQPGAIAETPAVAEPASKRQKSDPGSSSGSVSPSGSIKSGLVRCCCCLQACHVTCLPAALRKQYMQRAAVSTPGKGPAAQRPQQEQQQQLEPYFCSPSCHQVACHLANRCAQGLVQVDALADGTPVCWQLIQPAAVAAALLPPPQAAAAAVAAAFAGSPVKSPQKANVTPVKKRAGKAAAAAAAAAPSEVGLLGTGVAPAYTRAQAQVLSQVLRDVHELMQQQLGPAWEVRTFQDTLPWLVSGLRCRTPGGLLDLSHIYVAVLWVGSTLSAAALVRFHGTAMLEVSLAATLEQLQHKQLGRLLISCVERFALETCKVHQAWMPALGGVVKPCVGVSVLPSWERPAGVRETLQLTQQCAVKLLGISSRHQQEAAAGTAAAAATAASAELQQQQQQQQAVKDTKTCWALQLRYGPAPTVVDWLQLPRHMLLRYSYVPFVTKRLSPETLVPLPKFRKQQQRAGPASTGAPPPPAAAAAPAAASPSAAGVSAGGAPGAACAPTTDTPGQTKQQKQTNMTNSLQLVTDVDPRQTDWQQKELPPLIVKQVPQLTGPLVHEQQIMVHKPCADQQLQQSVHQLVLDQEQASMMLLQPQLHQLPPRVRKQSVLQEQAQQQIVKQQLICAARLAGTADSVSNSVEARIAAGIAAYGSCGAVVGVSGVNKQLL